jgi:hypothetical protein
MPDDRDFHDQDAGENLKDPNVTRRKLNLRPMTPLLEGLQEAILKAEVAAPELEDTWTASAPYQGSRWGAMLDAMQEPLIAEYARLTMLLNLRRHPEVMAALKSMPFNHFLSTRYWFLVRAYTFYQRGHVCERCQATGELEVYHLRKDHQGSEFFHPEDVRVLCQSCGIVTIML